MKFFITSSILIAYLGITAALFSSVYTVTDKFELTPSVLAEKAAAVDVINAQHCSLRCLALSSCCSSVYSPDDKKCYVFENRLRVLANLSSRAKLISQIIKQNDARNCYYRDCQDAHDAGDVRNNEVYMLQPGSSNESVIEAVCQFDATSGWTVIQRRLDGSVDFFRYWSDYVDGFGNKSGEYWLGLNSIFMLTKTNQKLSIHLEDHDGNTRLANYSTFYIDDSESNYKLHIFGYRGNAGDSMTNYSVTRRADHNNQMFSTWDADHDSGNSTNCASSFTGAWWYNNCHWSNLNGIWYAGGYTSTFATGINWYTWKGHYYSLKTSYIRITR